MDKVRRYYNTKKATAKHQGIPFELELRDIHFLLFMARITVDQIGKRRGQYHLARFNDGGPYAIGNCRFITMESNMAERDSSYPKGTPFLTPEERARRGQRMREYCLKHNSTRPRDSKGRCIR